MWHEAQLLLVLEYFRRLYLKIESYWLISGNTMLHSDIMARKFPANGGEEMLDEKIWLIVILSK